MNETKEVAVTKTAEIVDSSVDISHAKELVAIRSQELQLDKEAHRQLLSQAQVFFDAKALPESIKNAPQVYMMLKAGQERGLSEVESLNSFYFVKGKLSMYGPSVIAQVMKAGHIIEWGECDAKQANVKITRGDNPKVNLEDTLTYEEAKQAGGTSDVWKKHTKNMLKYRVFRMVANFVCPDALQGISVESDTGFITDPSGKVIDVEDAGVMSQHEIGVYYRRLNIHEGYTKELISGGINEVLKRDKFGDLTYDEAAVLETWLRAKKNEQPDMANAPEEVQGELV